MSGGYFDYAPYRIDDIIESIEREIEAATCKRTELLTKHGVSVWYTSEDGKHQWSDGRYYNRFANFAEAEQYFTACNRYTLQWKKPYGEGEWKMRIKDTVTGELLEVRSFTYTEYAPDEEGNIPHYPDYTKETLQEFRNGIAALKRASVYARRIDWLLSGDDGEDDFHRRLNEELEQLIKEEVK